MKTYDLQLDRKNQGVLIKKLYNKTMTKREKQRLCRTIRVIENTYEKIELNKRYEDKVNELFF